MPFNGTPEHGDLYACMPLWGEKKREKEGERKVLKRDRQDVSTLHSPILCKMGRVSGSTFPRSLVGKTVTEEQKNSDDNMFLRPSQRETIQEHPSSTSVIRLTDLECDEGVVHSMFYENRGDR